MHYNAYTRSSFFYVLSIDVYAGCKMRVDMEVFKIENVICSAEAYIFLYSHTLCRI